VVEVATKGTSNLELENTDLIEPDFLIQSGKKNDATEAEAAKENGQKSAQKEETEIVTLATFGLPPVVTEELQGTAAIGSQLDKEQESKIEEEGKGASEVATSRVEESTQQKTTTTQGGHAVGGGEQLSNPENADGKSITVEEKTAQLTREVGKFLGQSFSV